MGLILPICLCPAFTCPDPKSAKKTDSLTVFVALLGSESVKVAPNMFIKSTPVANPMSWHAPHVNIFPVKWRREKKSDDGTKS